MASPSSATATFQRFFEVPGHAISDGILYVEPHQTRRSAVFEAVGYHWSLLFDPVAAGYGDAGTESVGIWLLLETLGAAAVAVEVDFGLVDPSGAHPVWRLSEGPFATELFSRDRVGTDAYRFGLGLKVRTVDLNYRAPGPGFLKRGGLLIQCTITVLAPAAPQPPVEQQDDVGVSPPPESDLTVQLAGIRATGKGADVTFSVRGVEIPAHRIILAMRSPVFDAELFGSMLESTTSKVIKVEDMDPQVFLALLDYIYTDALPPSAAEDDGQNDDDDGFLRALLVAADRYCVDRLKLLCEHRLCTALSVENVTEMLELASDVGCSVLKGACIEFMSQRLDQVKETQGYKRVRETCPMVLLDALEKTVCRRDDMCSD